MPQARKSQQISMNFAVRRHGGPRVIPKRKRTSRNIPHGKRKRFSSMRPLHSTLRLCVSGLRIRRLYAVLYRVFCESCEQGRQFRIVHYSVQQNHLHLIVEAKNRAAMSRGMQITNMRIARRINCALKRKGRVVSDRYHEEHLESPRQVRNALAYVLNNYRRHLWKDRGERCSAGWIDPCSSAAYFDGWSERRAVPLERAGPVAPAEGWLLTVGWRRGGAIACGFVPGA